MLTGMHQWGTQTSAAVPLSLPSVQEHLARLCCDTSPSHRDICSCGSALLLSIALQEFLFSGTLPSDNCHQLPVIFLTSYPKCSEPAVSLLVDWHFPSMKPCLYVFKEIRTAVRGRKKAQPGRMPGQGGSCCVRLAVVTGW